MGLRYSDGISWKVAAGTVTSVGASGSTGLTITGSPITSSGTLQFTLSLNLQALSNLASTGFVVQTGAGSFAQRTITAGTGMSISNGNGVSGNPTVSLGTVPLSNLAGFPNSSNLFLRGDGTWISVDLSSNVVGSLPISRISGYPSNSSLFLNGSGTWATPTLNFLGISGQLNLLSYGLTTSGTISTTTGTLQANNIAAYNSGSVVFASSIAMGNNNIGGIGYLGVNNIQAASGSNINLFSNLSMASSSVRIYADNGFNYFYSSGGTWFFVNGLTTGLQYSYGYLNSGGNTGTSSGTNAYSISCSARVAASEFNAISSRQIKNVLARGEDIESEALEAFGSLSLAKYEYKDKIAYGDGITYGLIAEEVADVFPHYVHSHQAYVPNILQRAIVKKNKETDAYTLSFEEDIETGTLEGEKVRIFSHDKTLEATLQKSSRRTIRILSPEKLDQEVFVYGTYEECPTLTKNKLFELSMVVLKNVLRRVEKIEKSLETRYNP